MLPETAISIPDFNIAGLPSPPLAPAPSPFSPFSPPSPAGLPQTVPPPAIGGDV